MGFLITCCEKSFCCSYTAWNELMRKIMEATHIYLYNQLELNKETEDETFNANKIHIEKLMRATNPKNDFYIENYMKIARERKYRTAMDYFKADGLSSLTIGTNKQLLPPEDAYKVIILLDAIRPIMKNLIEYYDDTDLIEVFQESWNEKENIVIG